ncbi:MAG: DUF4118 domain-containing protein [Dehalococcoidia bacterium]|nr:DUF4118 domain-containing protein [Dehalococcoidia bacterium]
MTNKLKDLSKSSLVGYVAGLASVGLVGGLIGLLLSHFPIANLSMLYLIPVLATAVVFGRGPAVLTSLMAFLTFNWFFIKPLHNFTIADPGEWIALLLFLLTAGITGQLAAGQRQRTEQAKDRQREAAVLYDVVRLMSGPDLDHALHAVAERLRQELQLAGVTIEFTGDSDLVKSVAVGDENALSLLQRKTGASVRILGQGAQPTASQLGAPGAWIRVIPPYPRGGKAISATDRIQVVPIRVKGRQAGELLLVPRSVTHQSNPANDRLLSAVATQLGSAVERVLLQREATEAEILRGTDELKTALLNAVSHDLRTPLASIIASAGSLRQHDVAWTGEEQQELAATIEEEALRLNQIVGNLLDLSRMEGGSLKPEKAWYDLGALVDDVLGRFRPLTEKHHIIVDVPDDLPPVLLDYVEIDQVLSNLVENATKYTQPGTEIRISARRCENEIQIEIADHGPGIPTAALSRLFEPFYRVSVGGPQTKGTGLGLAVTKGLVEAHGGRIWAENQPTGGARFIFTLPLSEPEASP